MKKVLPILTILLLLPCNIIHSFVDSYTLVDSISSEIYGKELYIYKRDFISISSMYYWGDILKGKLCLSYRDLIGELNFSQMFSISVYSYSGNIDDNITSGSYSLCFGMIKDLDENITLGGKLKISYSYLIDVNSFKLSGDAFGKFYLLGLTYSFLFENLLSIGFSSTYYGSYLAFVPLVFDNSIEYRISKLSFIGGFKLISYIYELPYNQIDLKLGIGYEVSSNFKLSLVNTFKNGNYLNLSISPDFLYKDFNIIAKLSYSYITFLEGGIEIVYKLNI